MASESSTSWEPHWASSDRCEDFGSDWTRFPIARLHYTKATGLWAVYWRDRNLKYHRYQPLEPSLQIQDLLDYLDSGADPIFWG